MLIMQSIQAFATCQEYKPGPSTLQICKPWQAPGIGKHTDTLVDNIFIDNSQLVAHAHVAKCSINSGYYSIQLITLLSGSRLLKCCDDLLPELV